MKYEPSSTKRVVRRLKGCPVGEQEYDRTTHTIATKNERIAELVQQVSDLTRQRDEARREAEELRAFVRGTYWRKVYMGGYMMRCDWTLTPERHAELVALIYPKEDSPNA